MNSSSPSAIYSQAAANTIETTSAPTAAESSQRTPPSVAERQFGVLGALADREDRSNRPVAAGHRLRVALPGEPSLASSHDTPRIALDVPLKTQSKMTDCWYASIQMLLSWKAGEKTKPIGENVQQHRDFPLIGRKLAFGSEIGGKIMADNGLVAVGDKLDLNDTSSLATVLAAHGPIILNGKFDPLRQGHTVVLSGIDPATQQVAIHDPSWTGGVQWKPMSYLYKIFKTPGSDNVDSYAAVALASS
ncbi:papain-like cysteine protease family protein [Burkholderia sp. AU6039]|uniref:papain-like cysteine protease family protein n=1 Tax=Burkholderia sp. AU6039 TaxID=2015344 RepID=UPI000B7A1039|nr:papain-like cysteine protease family protein [Burkholderia sp. AU6039]OXJ06548.1 hypothetical protein CFB39_38950 [Burkholderia sp. AU6039]